jgi:hypothetical protein
MTVSLKENNWFFVMDQTSCPYPTRSLPAQFWHRCMEWSTVWVSSKPLSTEGNWLGQGLNLCLPNDTLALYPLLHELMLMNHFYRGKKMPYKWGYFRNKKLSKSKQSPIGENSPPFGHPGFETSADANPTISSFMYNYSTDVVVS